MYEITNQPVLPWREFIRRISRHLAVAAGIIVFSLTIGVLGYHFLADLSWVDSFLNATMILSSMGQVSPLEGNTAKLFASFYALYSGIIFLLTVGMVISPAFDHILHRFHMETEQDAAE
jgi:hypothetical protein